METVRKKFVIIIAKTVKDSENRLIPYYVWHVFHYLPMDAKKRQEKKSRMGKTRDMAWPWEARNTVAVRWETTN